MGAVEPADGRDEVIRIVEERRDSYRKLLIRDDKLIGAVLVGHGASDFAASLVRYYDTGEPLPENRGEVFCPSGGSGPARTTPRFATATTSVNRRPPARSERAAPRRRHWRRKRRSAPAAARAGDN